MQLPGWVSLQCTSGAEDQPERYGAGCLLIPRHLTPLIARLRLVLIRGSILLLIIFPVLILNLSLVLIRDLLPLLLVLHWLCAAGVSSQSGPSISHKQRPRSRMSTQLHVLAWAPTFSIL